MTLKTPMSLRQCNSAGKRLSEITALFVVQHGPRVCSIRSGHVPSTIPLPMSRPSYSLPCEGMRGWRGAERGRTLKLQNLGSLLKKNPCKPPRNIRDGVATFFFSGECAQLGASGLGCFTAPEQRSPRCCTPRNPNTEIQRRRQHRQQHRVTHGGAFASSGLSNPPGCILWHFQAFLGSNEAFLLFQKESHGSRIHVRPPSGDGAVQPREQPLSRSQGVSIPKLLPSASDLFRIQNAVALSKHVGSPGARRPGKGQNTWRFLKIFRSQPPSLRAALLPVLRLGQAFGSRYQIKKNKPAGKLGELWAAPRLCWPRAG